MLRTMESSCESPSSTGFAALLETGCMVPRRVDDVWREYASWIVVVAARPAKKPCNWQFRPGVEDVQRF
jgi:hypothetical protein